MSQIDLQNITKRFPGTTALKEISFTVQRGEFFVLLGPTGAGKTTTLRIIAGLEEQDEGSISFDGELMDGLPPASRDVAFVFQQYSLYPTMSVYDNLAFPLRSPQHRFPEDEIKKKVSDAAEILRINHLLERKTAHLSGGEMQRVSIGRAIVRNPRVFLMDEPLSNLDAKLRESLRVELQHLQKTLNATTIFVTHDQIEALTMADRIAVLNQGRIIQIGTPKDIYDRPATTFVAQLVGTPRINLLHSHRENGALQVTHCDMHVPVPAGLSLPDEILLGIRPEDIIPDPEGGYEGSIILKEPLGVETIVHLEIGGVKVVSLLPGMTHLKLGDKVRYRILADRLHFFAPDGQRVQG